MNTELAYRVGSRVAHPVHGAGTITGIEEKSIGDVSHTYYVIETHNMQLLVAVSRADDMGLRLIGRPRRLEDLLSSFSSAPKAEELVDDYKVRQAAMKELIKSGSLDQVAQAIRILHCHGTRKKLGVVDTRLYASAINTFASELALAQGSEVDDAKAEIEKRLARMILAGEDAAA